MRPFLPAIALLLMSGSTVLSAQQRLNDPREWITADDYPPAALAAQQEGIVILHYDVSEAGHVENCTVEQDVTAIPELIETTCRLVMERARYAPAGDEAGRATRSDDAVFVHWRLPPGTTSAAETDFGGAFPTMMPFSVVSQEDLAPRLPSAPKGEEVHAEFAITPAGRIEHCQVQGGRRKARELQFICDRLTDAARFRPPVDEAGQPIATKGRIMIELVSTVVRRVPIN